MLRPSLAALAMAALVTAAPAPAATLGTTSILSVSSGTSGGDGSPKPLNTANGGEAITPDGRYVAFVDSSSNLTSTPDANGGYDVFWRDTQTGQTKLVSINATGDGAGNSDSDQPAISDDGRYVAFRSFADNLLTGYSGSTGQIYVRDMQTGTTTLVSRAATAATTGGNGISIDPVMTGDGRYVVWDTKASNIETPDIVGPAALSSYQIAVRDLQAGTTTFVTVDPAGATVGNKGNGYYYSITPNGRYVAFESGDTNLVNGFVDPGGSPARTWVYRRDLQANTTVLVSPSAGTTANGANGVSGDNAIAMSDDGRYIAFDASATDLIAGFTDNDTAFGDDVFLRDVTAGTTTLVSGTSATASGEESSLSPQMSSDGRYVMFFTDANDLVAGDTNNNPDLLRWDRTTGQRVVVDAASGSSTPPGGGSGVPFPSGTLSADGNDATFSSDAPGMGYSGGGMAVFLRDIGAGTTQLISSVPASAGQNGNQSSQNPWMSADGTRVTWTSKATDLVAGFTDLNGTAEDFFTRATGISPPASGGSSGGGSSDTTPPADTAPPSNPVTSTPLGSGDQTTPSTTTTGPGPTGAAPKPKPRKKHHKKKHKRKKHRRHHRAKPRTRLIRH